MATSGTVTYSPTELELYNDALGNLGVLGGGQTALASDIELCRRKLNLLVKQWVSQADFAPGLKLWSRRRGYIFLQDGQTEYDIGPGGDPSSDGEYVTTTLTANSATSDTTLTVASITGIATTNPVGVQLDDGSIHWTTVNGAPSGQTVTITSGVASAAASGNRVFVYATLMRKPFEIVSAVLRDAGGNDVPMDPALSVEEYEAIPVKSSVADPYRMYFEPRRSQSKVFLDCAPADTTKVIRVVYLSYIEDMTTNTGEVDFPQEWLRPLAAQLSIDLAPSYERQVSPALAQLAAESLAIAKNANPARSTAYFLSEPDAY